LTSDPPPLICCGNLTLDDVVLPDGTEQPCSVGGDALYGVLAARLFLPEAQMLAPVGHDLPPHVWALMGRGFPVPGSRRATVLRSTPDSSTNRQTAVS
jgi:hypothetical protein